MICFESNMILVRQPVLFITTIAWNRSFTPSDEYSYDSETSRLIFKRDEMVK